MRNVFTSVCLSILFISASAFGQKAGIEGNAMETNGKPMKKVDVRIENEKAKVAPVMVKTDAKGHFQATNLTPGVYTVTVLLNGTVKYSAAHVKAVNGQMVHLNLSQQPAVAVTAANTQPKKRAVWVPDTTGSRLGGHWEDQPVRGPGADNVDGMTSDQLSRMQNTRALPPSTGGR